MNIEENFEREKLITNVNNKYSEAGVEFVNYSGFWNPQQTEPVLKAINLV